MAETTEPTVLVPFTKRELDVLEPVLVEAMSQHERRSHLVVGYPNLVSAWRKVARAQEDV